MIPKRHAEATSPLGEGWTSCIKSGFNTQFKRRMPDECQFSIHVSISYLKTQVELGTHSVTSPTVEDMRGTIYQRRSTFQASISITVSRYHGITHCNSTPENNQHRSIAGTHLLPSQQCYPQLSEMPYSPSTTADEESPEIRFGCCLTISKACF